MHYCSPMPWNTDLLRQCYTGNCNTYRVANRILPLLLHNIVYCSHSVPACIVRKAVLSQSKHWHCARTMTIVTFDREWCVTLNSHSYGIKIKPCTFYYFVKEKRRAERTSVRWCVPRRSHRLCFFCYLYYTIDWLPLPFRYVAKMVIVRSERCPATVWVAIWVLEVHYIIAYTQTD